MDQQCDGIKISATCKRQRSRAMSAALKGIVAGRRRLARAWAAVLGAVLTASLSGKAQEALSNPPNSPGGQMALQSAGDPSPWEERVGEGFRCGAQSLTLSAAGAYSLEAIGGQQSHDLVFGSATYGLMLTDTRGRGHWYGGNFELRVQLWGGAQVSPSREYVVGLTPHIRYNFATGTRWVPYIDGGAGVTLTGIREPDLGGIFQFNLQANVGIQRFLTDNMCVSLQAGYLHMSSAGIYTPNLGVNCVTGMLGVSFFF